MSEIDVQNELDHLRRQLAMTVALKFHLMPTAVPAFPDVPSVDVYADQITLAQVGGDFYDYFRIDADHIGLLVADIFDGGDAAALYMIALKLYLAGELTMGFDAAKLIGDVNNRLCHANEDDLCLSAWYGVYEISTGVITAVNAGHEPPLLLRDGQVSLCPNEVSSYLLAVMEGIPYESYEIRLEPGDRLLLYTDGVTAAKDSAGAHFTEEMIRRVLATTGGMDSEEAVGTLQDALFAHVGEEPLRDDATFLCLSRKGDPVA
ncbi:MAG: serine/threonine-protein phosphatase [Butyrivibrio sp.]|nr:serine/threonine-protein phosphatase [Butyrivibrio sp.]